MLIAATNGGLNVWLHQLGVDDRLATLLVLILVDVIVGVGAAVKNGTFRLSYFADFARTDLLGKVLPWGVVYVVAKAAGSADIIPGVDLNLVQNAMWVALVAAIGASILSSLRDLGIGLRLPDAIAANEANDPRPPLRTSGVSASPVR